MKRLITAIIIPFFCLALAVGGSAYTDRTLTKSISEIEIMENESDIDSLRAQKLFSKWEKDKKLLAILLKHEDVDEMEIHLGNIVCAAENESEDYKYILDEARNFITGVRDGERLSPQSVF